MDAGYLAAITGLVGALIGSATSVVTMVIQGRARDRRDRSKQITDLALAEFKMHLDLATSGKGPSAIPPLSIFLLHHDLLLKAIEEGKYDTAKNREISAALAEMMRTVEDLDKEHIASAKARAGQPT